MIVNSSRRRVLGLLAGDAHHHVLDGRVDHGHNLQGVDEVVNGRFE